MVSVGLGYVGAVVAILCFGTYAVPVKLVNTGDGMFFQWVECCAIMVVGIVAQLVAGSPYHFEPLAMVGGVMWCLGNLTVVPIVSLIGLGLGMLLWGVFNMATGWSCGTFGIVIAKETVSHPWLNYVGMVVALVSVSLYLPIKTTLKADEESINAVYPGEESQVLVRGSRPLSRLAAGTDYGSDGQTYTVPDVPEEAQQKRSPALKLLLGLSLSAVAGLFYGTNMIPVSLLSQRHPEAHPLAYAMSHYCGIFLASTVALVVHTLAARKGRPQLSTGMVVPALCAGVLWGVAQCGWFVGNAGLGLTISFPLICTGPGIVASLWGVLYFREIRGGRNFAWLLSAFALTVLGILLITFSK